MGKEVGECGGGESRKKCGVGGSRRRMLCRRRKEGEVLQKYGVGRSGR